MKTRKWPKKFSKKYLRRASVYRRAAGRNSGMDFSFEALEACFDKESIGKPCHDRNNGFLFGKWALDISITTWIEDIEAGHFCKADFYTPITRWYAEPALQNVIPPTWFPFDKSNRT